MKNNYLLKPLVIAVVSLLHAGVIALAWEASKPPEPVAVDNLTVVDLGSIYGNDKPIADGAPAPLESEEQPAPPPPPPPPEPEKQPVPEQPKPKVDAPPKVNTVVRNDVPADVIAKPVEHTPPKPVESPKPIEHPKQPAPPKPAAEPPKTPSTATAGGNPDAVNRQANGTGGGGSNPNSLAPQNNAGGIATGDGTGARGTGTKMTNTGGGTGGGESGGSTIDGGYVKLPDVAYPSASETEGEEGTVRLSITVEPNNTVSDVTIIKSTGYSRLDNAARRAARNAGYRAKVVNGSPVRTKFTTSYEFKIND